MMANLENVETIAEDTEGIDDNHGLGRKFKKARVYGFRDFPDGCGPLKSVEDFGSLVKKPNVPCLVSTLEQEDPEEESVSEKNESEFDFETPPMFLTPALLDDSLKDLEEEEEEGEEKESVSEEAAFDLETSPKFVTPASLDDECSRSDADLVAPPVTTTTATRVYPPRRGSWSGVRDFPLGCGRNIAPLTTDHESAKSKFISNDVELSIVLALMAPQKCPWSQNKRKRGSSRA